MPKPSALRFQRSVSGPVRALLVAFIGFGLSSCQGGQDEPTGPGDSAANMDAGKSQEPDVAPAIRAHNRHLEALMSLPAVVGTAVGYTANGRLGILVFTAHGAAGGIPADIEGFPVERRVTGKVVAQVCTPTTCKNTDVWPLPVPIGISTGPGGRCYSGTIAARVKAGSSVYALSNNHVYADVNTVPIGTAVYQTGLGDVGCNAAAANNIGTLSSYVTLALCGGSCPNNTMDAAIAVSTTTKLDRKTPPAGYGTPNTLAWGPATLNMPLKKYGRTTSLTSGIVTGINAAVTVTYPSGNARFINQIIVSSCPGPCSDFGDSGSLWVSNDAVANPVALHFAGTGTSIAFASPVGPVLSFFGVTVDGNPAPPTATGGTISANCGVTCGNPRLVSFVASGNTITVRDNGSHVLTMTLTGVTATGGLVANCGVTCSNAYITSVTAAGGNAISVRDNGGHTGVITLTGATAIRGLAANCGVTCTNAMIRTVTASGLNGFFLGDNGGHTDYIKFQ